MTREFEWPSLMLVAVTYAVWILATTWLAGLTLWLAIPVLAVAMAQHSSLQHEAIHGHPFRWEAANTLLMWPPLTLAIPYFRFRDTHLDHHRDSDLTDPYDDPESNFVDPGDWERLPGLMRGILMLNNTLAGRLLLGPAIGTLYFIRNEMRNAPSDPRVWRGWAWHLVMVLPVLVWVVLAPVPVWAYLAACYGAVSLLKIRTFLEHRAHELSRARTVIIEDRGPLALLFLNNNLHVVHHMHPEVAWYRLPAVFRARRARFLDMNDGYLYRSYGEVFRRYFLARKDPVAHPLWRRG